ncbi:hypothetical protein [Seonamhaeicola sp. ML3]|uniref:hypothetical protein n=1 Tax=Seonamhaeicola sp. ML3 TaxID=2937786 RepID=UPI00200E6B10|nr:hypothetical protein [Seonamhaeicola sp. ML3]
MKSNFFFVLLLLIVTEHAFAQKTKFHIVELLPNTTETKEDVDFFISEVIDNRIYKNNIGIAQKGLLNKKVLSKFGKPFEEEVLDYFKTVFPETVSGKPLGC